MRKLMFTLLGVLCLSLQLLAQNRTITGRVTDEQGRGVPNASVTIKGTKQGTTADQDGRFTLSVPANATLVFSSTNFDAKEVSVGNQSTVNVGLQPADKSLQEVVVVGYEVRRKRDVAGAVSSVPAKQIENLPVGSFDKAIQGKLPGVQVTSTSGIPGGAVQVRVRGVGSINAGTSPLYIVDGVQVNSGDNTRNFPSSNALAAINPDDILSIDVLKDPASASIYGAQAANGVVIITTKRGRSGQTKVGINVYGGYSERIRKIPVLTTPQVAYLGYESLLNRYGKATADANLVPFFGTKNLDSLPTYDWQDIVFRKGSIQNYEANVSGGNDKTTFYLSGSYNKIFGQVVFSDFGRGTVKLNLDHKISDKFTIGTAWNFSSFKQNGVSGGGAFVNPMRSGILMWPGNNPYNPDGTYNVNFYGTYYINPLRTADFNTYNANTNNAIGNVALTYNIVPGLSFRSSFNLDYKDIKENSFQDPRTEDGSATNGYFTRVNSQIVNFQTNHVLNYNHTYNDIHTLTGLLGIEYRENTTTAYISSGQSVPSYQFGTLGSAAIPAGNSSAYDQFKLMGYFARAEYNLMQKYTLTATIRRDGSSRFGANNQYGWFPSVAAMWRLSKEEFMSPVTFINDLKLRASWGKTGNNLIGSYASRNLFGSSGTYLGAPGAAPAQLGDANLTWEENKSYNFGLDFAVLKNRVSGSVDYFVADRSKLLLNYPVPITSGFSSIVRNAGSLRNQGLEVGITTRNIDGRDFKWSTTFSHTIIKNKVTKLTEGQDKIGTTIVVGMPINALFTYKYAGVNPADGRPMWYDTLGNITYIPAGRDRYYLPGTLEPTFFGGITNEFSFKGFELRVFLQYSGGNYLLNQDAIFASRSGSTIDRNQYASQLRRWTKPGDITDVPKAYYGGTIPGTSSNYFLSDRFYEKGDYLRLKELSIAYNLSNNVTKRLHINSARIYINATNVYTWSNYTGFDPELVNGTTGDFGVYPQAKTYVVGLQLGL